MTQKLKTEILTAAIAGLESKKARIDDQIHEIRAMLSGGSNSAIATPESEAPRRRRFSPASRRRMAAAQKARWAKLKGKSDALPELVTPETPKPKRQISPEGLKRIIAATKKRWALKRAEAAKAQPASAKKTAAKRAAVKKAAVKASPAKAAKRAAKKAAKKTAPVPATTETAGQ
jgi:hypothetical protein